MPESFMNAPIPTEAAAKPLADAEIRLIIIGVLMAMFLGALDQTIVATALPTMGRELGSFELLPWIVTSYLVTSTAITPLYGKVSDIVGRRPTLLVGIGVFVLGSIACALSTTMTTLFFFRARRAWAVAVSFRSHKPSSPTLSRRKSELD